MHERGIVSMILFGAVLLLVACQPVQPIASTPDSAQAPLVGTEWLLNELHGEHLIHEESVTARFGADGMLEGLAGCNEYMTPYQTDGSEIAIDPNFDAGDNVCGEAIMAVESAYLATLQQVAAFEIEEAVLFMRDDNGSVTLVYDARIN
jgi:heat shock protein HslJ